MKKRLIVNHTSIKEQNQLRESLRLQKELSANIIQDAPIIIIVMDKEGKITEFNPFAEKLLGYKRKEIIGSNITTILNVQPDIGYEIFRNSLESKSENGIETELKCKDNRIVTTFWNHNLLHDKLGRVQGIVFIGIDITDRRKMEKDLKFLAFNDTLTGLINRTYFEKKVNEFIRKWDQTNIKSAFIYLDIDDFKHINDSMGHIIGDQLIRHIGTILTEHFKAPHIVSRISGDEFAIMLIDIPNQAYVYETLEQLLLKLRTPWILDTKRFFVSVSIGISIYPNDGKDFSTLLQNADIAMFNVKQNGKDNYAFFKSTMYQESVDYIEMSNELRGAIENDEFMLHYQPVFDLRTGSITGVEALIRWNHPKKGIISPIEFIPFAEKTGFILQITEWVLNTACKQKRKWNDQGLMNIKIAVNLSGQMVTELELVERIKSIIDQYKVDYKEIELEVTETTVMQDLDKANEVINRLRELGFSIALDDFGSGYSSLTYLQSIPFDVLKIDRGFTKNITKENDESYILKAIIELAHNMGVKVVAEGIETVEQKTYLTNNYCDIGQGYYFSKPVLPVEINKYFANAE